jgi:hypothetical protein
MLARREPLHPVRGYEDDAVAGLDRIVGRCGYGGSVECGLLGRGLAGAVSGRRWR